MKSISLLVFVIFIVNTGAFSQNVGIGTSTPEYRLDVNGPTRVGGNLLVNGFVGIGTTSPIYKLQVNDGSLAIHSTADNIFWTVNYNSATNYLGINYEGTPRMVFENTGNVGINVTNPAYRLDVGGSIHTNANLVVDGTATFDGNLTVNGGRGVMQNTAGSAQLKYYTRETAFSVALAGDALSGEGSFGFASAGFTTVPVVMPADIVSTGGTSGQLYRVQMIIYGCTTTSCKVRLLNTSPNAINYDVTWNVVCIGN